MAKMFQARTRQDVEDLVKDLREALAYSERTGGQKLVYRKDGGEIVLAVEVHVAPKAKGGGRSDGTD